MKMKIITEGKQNEITEKIEKRNEKFSIKRKIVRVVVVCLLS